MRGGAEIEAGAEAGVPAHVVALAHLVFEEASHEQAVRAGRLEHLGVDWHVGRGHEVVEDRTQRGGRRKLGVGVGGDLRVVRQHARVVEQLAPVDIAL